MLLKTQLACLLCFAAFALPAQSASSLLEVYEIFQQKCASCHDNATPDGGLDLQGAGVTAAARALNVAAKLVNINPANSQAAASGVKRIYPGRPDRSFLFKKINAGFEPAVPALHTAEGNPMPGNGGALSNVEKELIRQWILYGAKTTGIQFSKALIENFYAGNGDKAFPDGPPPAPAPGEGFQIKMGPFFLAPDGEVEYFQKYELDLPSNVEVNRLDFKISPYSHHFILYNFNSLAGANAVAHGLRPNPNHSDIGLVAAVQEATDLQLPNNTAFRWDKQRVLDLNAHYINYSLSKVYQAEAYINVYTQPVGTAAQEMFATLLVNPSIPIPNNGNTITHTKSEFQSGAGNIHIWGAMGHTHKYGTGYKVWKRLPGGIKGELIYDAACPGGIPGCGAPMFDYQHIPIRYWTPSLPVNWSQGIIHEATWVNDGPTSVNFGPTSDDEMMVLIAFYTLNPITVSTEDPPPASKAEALRLWPNPAAEYFYVELPEEPSLRRIAVFNTAGQLIFQAADAPDPVFRVDTRAWSPGLYFVLAGGKAAVFGKE
jgi:hypothetical protein